MKAARFIKKRTFVIEEILHKDPKKNEVLIRVHYCGICGTDVHIFEGEKGSMEVETPRILGHEFSGEVAAVGEGVNDLKIGDRVTADVNYSCGHCSDCASGNYHFCSDLQGIGTAIDGAFAEYITVPRNAVFLVPDNISLLDAALVEPLSCCVHGLELTDLHIGDCVMIIGCGNIGLMMLQMCKHAGASKIIAVEPNATRLELAKKFGADILINPITDDTSLKLTENAITSINKVIDCAGLVATNEYAIRWAGKGATIMLFGLTAPDDEILVKPFELFQKELTIKGSFINPFSFEKALTLLKHKIVQVDDIITDVYPLDEIQNVFTSELYKKNGKTLIKVI